MGFDRESSTETSFMVRATGNGGLASPSAEYTTFPVRNPSGSLSRVVTGYSNFPLQPKVSSFMFRSNSPSFGHCNSNTTPPSQRNTSSGVMAFPSSAHWRAHFDASKDTDKLMVIDFTATWCGPCRAMDTVISDFAEKYTTVEFIKIDVDKLHDVAMKYQVVSMPTFLLMKKGNVVDKVVGADKEQLKAKIEHRLY